MKSKKLIILFSLLWIFNIRSINAIGFKEDDTVVKTKVGNTDTSGFKIGNYDYEGEYTYNTLYNGKNYVTYCEDPSRGAGVNYKIDRIIGDPTYRDHVRLYDAGILEILSKGYNQFNTSLTLDNGVVVSGDDLYLATSIAQRAFTFAHGFGNTPDTSMSDYFNAKSSGLLTLAIRWSGFYYGTEGDYKLNYVVASCKDKDCVEKTIANKYSWYKSSINITPAAVGSRSDNILKAAQKLFKMGVQAQKKYNLNKGGAFSIKGKINKYEDKDENGEALSEKRVYASIEVKNMNAETGYVRTVLVDCPTCKEQGITLGKVEYKFEGSSEWISDGVLSETNLTLGFNRENGFMSGTINIRINYTQNNDSEDCERAGFTISYDYFNNLDDVTGAVLRPDNVSGKQRFFVVEKTSEDGDAPLKGSMDGVFTCPKNEACDTEIQVPVCSDNEDEGIAKIQTNENIKRCILDNVDDTNNNSYQLIKDNGGLSDTKGIRDNDYCDIFCKEDYAEIKLNPIVEDVVCGGYFQLKSSIKGTKDCYTGGNTTGKAMNGEASIDKDKYLSDIERIQREMVSQTNIYLKNDAYLKSSGSNDGETCCGPILQITIPDYTKYTFTSNGESGSVESETVSSSDRIRPSCGKRREDGTCPPEESASSKYSKKKAAAKEARDAAETSLKELAKEYEQVNNDYNACTTVWTNEFKFAQEIMYYYDEFNNDNETWSPYYDLLSDEYKKLEKDGDLKETSTITICKGTTDNSYNCNGTKIELDGSIDKDLKLEEHNYSADYEGVFETRQYVFCTTQNCHYKNPMISQASFVKKSVSKEQNYITPTAFYQIAVNGKITVAEGFALDKVQAHELTHSLPVSTSDVVGGNFRLMIKDLGEFYDQKDKVGRLIDYDEIEFNGMNPESVAYAKDKNGVEDNFTGNYKCTYKSPCRPDDCPDCDIPDCDPNEEDCDPTPTPDPNPDPDTPPADCPDCEWRCEGPNCDWCEPGDSECPGSSECVGCIVDRDKLQLTVKTISTTNFESVGRTFGYNWITSSSMKALELLNSKASKTISEIKETNEMIYQDDKTSDDSSLVFSVKMTPEITRRIQKYNQEVSDNKEGGYLNDSLTCYDAVADGETYPNIYCYSDLIDLLVKDYSDEITVINRPESTAERKNYSKYEESDKGYWTLWDGYLKLKKNEVGTALGSDGNKILGGPSWK